MKAYYNENDPYPAQWLRNLMEAGEIMPGIVDTRSIEDVSPVDLIGFDRTVKLPSPWNRTTWLPCRDGKFRPTQSGIFPLAHGVPGMAWSRPFAALMRHAWAFWSGEDTDPETRFLHLAHVAWNGLALLEYQLSGNGDDDRPHGPKNTITKESLNG